MEPSARTVRQGSGVTCFRLLGADYGPRFQVPDKWDQRISGIVGTYVELIQALPSDWFMFPLGIARSVGRCFQGSGC
jgi:hypothetical protein